MANKFGNGTGAKRAGFTLPELLVSISIFVIITTAVIVNFRVGEQSGQLRLGAAAVVSALRTLQTMAQTGRLINLCDDANRQVCADDVGSCPTPGQCVPALPLGGYGIEVRRDGGITLFADVNRNRFYDVGEALPAERIALPGQIVIDPQLASPYDSQSEALSITFEPPEAVVWINGAETVGEARLGVRHTKTQATRAIILRRISGTIEVQ